MTISRRDILIGGSAGTAMLTALGCSGQSGVFNFVRGASLNAYYLPIQYATLNIGGGFTIRTRTYGGTVPGPTLTAAPGGPLNITVSNQLPPNPTPAPTPGIGIDPLDNPHAFNSTSLHAHGVQVIPHIFDPIGTSDPSASIIAIQPGTQLQYPFILPPDHPSGLYWYHPHSHGSTDTQVSGGMAGLIIVKGPIDQVPEIAAARDIPVAIQTLNLNLDPSSGMYTDEYIAYQPSSNGGYTPRSTNLFMLVNGRLVASTNGLSQGSAAAPPSQQPVWKSYAPPLIQMAPGEVVRLRILNGSNSLLMPLQLPGFAVYVIGVDGVNLLAPYRVPTGGNIPTSSGNRVELLIQAPSTPGTYTLASQPTNVYPGSDPSTAQWPQFNLLQIAVSGQPVSMSIPTSLPTPSRAYPLVAAGGYSGTRSVLFSQGANQSTSILAGTDLYVNKLAYRESGVMFTLALGTTEQWTVSNSMPQGHPFHIHTNSLQIMSMSGASPPIPTPYIADTVWIPPSGSVTFLMSYKQWRGKAVFHCHKLPHEDQGMMANILYT